MDFEEYLGWCPVENTVANRLKDNSLVHTLSSKCLIRKSTKLINQELKKSNAIKTYSQYLKCKKNILEKIIENTDVTDESDFSDGDYKKFYNSFEVTSKDQSKSDVGDEGFMWLYVEKQGRKKTESELDNENPDDLHPHIWEPSIDISVIEDVSDPFEKPSKTPKQKIANGLIDKQSKAKSCSPHKSNTKLNIKNVTSASTSKVDNVGSKLTLKKETPVKEGKELQSSKTKKTVNKSPKDVKRNLTAVINGVSRKTPEASEGDDWNDEFVPSDFQAQSTQIFSDTLSDAHRGRRSVSRFRFSQNEVMNQPRDSGIEEDSREENVSVNKKADDKNIVFNTRHKLPLKIIGEEKVTTKYKIISNKDLKPIAEEKKLLKHTIIEQIKEDSKKKSESSSDSEYVDTQNGDDIDDSKQETEESSDEYYDLHDEKNGMVSDDEKVNDSITINSPAKIVDGKVNKLGHKNQLLTEESMEESSVASKTSKKNTHAVKNKNKQIQKKNIHPNTKSDRSMNNESVISDIASLQSSPTSKKQNLSEESRKALNKSSDREQSCEIEPQQDLSGIVKNYKKSHFMDKNTEKDSKSIKSLDVKNYDSEDSEECKDEKIDFKLPENNDEEVKVPEQTSKQLSQIKKSSELANDEESSESEDEVKKDPPVQFILPDKKSDSEESEESEIEDTPAVFQSKKRDNDEEGNLSIHAERRLAEMKRIDFANYDDSEDSEEEKNLLPIKNSKKQKLEDSNDSEIHGTKESESDESEKTDSETDKKGSKPAKQTIIKNQDSDSEAGENVPNHTLNHLSQMKKNNLTNIDSSSDDEEIQLENKDQVLDNVKNQTADVEEDIMSSHEKQHLKKMKRLSFDNSSEDSDDSIAQKVEVDDDIDIEEHKITMPEGCQELELPKLMVEDSFSSGIMGKIESGADTALKSKKKNELSSKKVREASPVVDTVHYDTENETSNDEKIINKISGISENDHDPDISTLSPKASMQLNNLKKTDLNEDSDEESDVEEPRNVLTQANKVDVKLSDEDDDSDSDRSMSPSTTHRLSQYKKMNLIEKDSSSSSSEDENDEKNDVLPEKVESDNFKSDDSDKEKSEKSLKSNETSEEDHPLISKKRVSKESIKTCPADDNAQKGKATATDKDKCRKNIVIKETQESAGTEENYVESQELFSSIEDLTEGQSKASVLESNDQTIANEVSATPEPTEIFREKITNIPQLIEKEKLLPATHETTMTSSHFSPDEDIYLLEVPRNVFNNNLIGEQFSFSKTTLKVGLNAYEAFKRKVTPSLSCVFKSEDRGGDSYETINVRPVVSIVARRRKLVDEPDKPPHQENQKVEATGNISKSTQSDPTEIKKKKAKTKDATDSKKVKTSKKVNSSDMIGEPDKTKKTPKKKAHITNSPEKTKKTPKKKAHITNSPEKTKKSEKNENAAHSLAVTSNNEILYKNEKSGESSIKSERKEKTSKNENLKGSPKKLQKDDEIVTEENVVVDTITDAKKKKKKDKNVKSKKNKFDISKFVQKPKGEKKVKEKKLPKLEYWKDDVNTKRKLPAICDDDSNSIDDKNSAALSPPLKKQKTPIRDASNMSEEDEEQVKLASKSKSKSTIKKKGGVKIENKSKVTKPTNTVIENGDVFSEASTSPSTSKSRPENEPAKAEAKKSSKKRKSDALLSDHDDPNVIEKPVKKKKAKAAGEGKPKAITKAAKDRMAKETAEVKNTLFSLFQKTMKCDQFKFPNNPDSNPGNSKYKPLELEHTTSKKSRLDMMSSSSDEDDEKCNFNKSFKMREKPKPELHDDSSNSSSDFIPNSQSAFKCEDTKKPKKIFFNE